MQTVKLNLIPGSVMPVVNVSQYDVKRQFALSVYEGATAYDLTGKSVEIRGTKPDGNGFAYDAQDGVVSVSGNTVTISTTQQMTAVGGQTMAELRIKSGTTILGTINFIIDVENSALSDDTPISETEIPAIERLAEDQVEQAEAWARGTKSGTPVSSDEPQYHNNSKYWSEVAAQYAAGGLHFMGSVAFASIPTTGMVNGDMYNITDDFTTDARFIEGAGVAVKAGADIAWLDSVSKWDILALGGGGDELADLDDVDITSPAEGDLLQYDPAIGKWENSNAVPQELAAMQEAGAVNLVDITAQSQVVGGITITVNADKSISFSGSNTSGGTQTVYITGYFAVKKGAYIATLGSAPGTFATDFRIEGTTSYISGPGYNVGERGIDLSEDTSISWRLVFPNNANVDGKTIKPMLYDARLVNPPYQPFTMTNRELTDAIGAINAAIPAPMNRVLFDLKKEVAQNSSYTINKTINSGDVFLVFIYIHNELINGYCGLVFGFNCSMVGKIYNSEVYNAEIKVHLKKVDANSSSVTISTLNVAGWTTKTFDIVIYKLY